MVVKNQILGIGATMFEEVVIKISWHLSYSIKSYETFFIALYSGYISANRLFVLNDVTTENLKLL